MNLIDTHAHLQFEKFDSDRVEVVKRNSKQLTAVINPGAKLDSSEGGLKLAESVANFYAAVGVHPHHVDEWEKNWIIKLEELALHPKAVAIGEIGLDKHVYQDYPAPNLKKQIEILVPQIKLATELNKPILFHCRKAYDELYNLLKKFAPLQGLIHCFMGDKLTAQKFLDLGLLISFAGNLTYKNNVAMREAVESIPLNKLLVETDSPYLTPEPLRGERNEPINVILIAKTIAAVKNISLEEVEKATTQNARALFRI